jgi:DNA polymerase-3 subunit alpha
MDNIPLFGDRKNGRAQIEYPHPLLEGILAETYGIFVYQEQVMQAAQVLAGYTLGGADLLRRAMGKKIKAEMDQQRAIFVKGCAEHNQIPGDKANELFDLIDKFAGYGFNKSHAAAYALVAYQTAWMKAHHKPEFFAASMCYDMALTDKLAIWVDDMRRSGVPCLPPCINASAAEFTVEEVGVRYALGALKGVGEKAMEQLIAEREAKGAFASLADFADRVDPRGLNRRQLESLAGAGAFDSLVPERAGVFAAAETILAHASSAAEARESGQGGLFAGPGEGVAPIRLPPAVHWSIAERMAAEKEAFGFYFSAHPVDRFRHLAEANKARSFAELAAMPAPSEPDRDANGRRLPSPTVKMAALVEDARWRTSARGRRYLLASLSDASSQFMASCFDDAVSADLEAAARDGACVLLTAELDRKPGEETPRVTVRMVQPFDGLAGNARLRLDIVTADPHALPLLAQIFEGTRGGRGEVRLHALLPEGGAVILLGRDYLLDAEMAAQIARLPGIVSADLKAADPPRLALVS